MQHDYNSQHMWSMYHVLGVLSKSFTSIISFPLFQDGS